MCGQHASLCFRNFCHNAPFAAQCSFPATMGLSRHNVPFAAQWAFRGTMFLLRHNAPFAAQCSFCGTMRLSRHTCLHHPVGPP